LDIKELLQLVTIYIYNGDLDYVIVMDSDGDDNPDDISILLENQSSTFKIIFANAIKDKIIII
jgi:hypothetical protein